MCHVSIIFKFKAMIQFIYTCLPIANFLLLDNGFLSVHLMQSTSVQNHIPAAYPHLSLNLLLCHAGLI